MFIPSCRIGNLPGIDNRNRLRTLPHSRSKEQGLHVNCTNHLPLLHLHPSPAPLSSSNDQPRRVHKGFSGPNIAVQWNMRHVPPNRAIVVERDQPVLFRQVLLIFLFLLVAGIPAVKNEFIRRLCVAHDSTLWIGTDHAGVLSVRDGVISAHHPVDSLSANAVRLITERKDRKGLRTYTSHNWLPPHAHE